MEDETNHQNPQENPDDPAHLPVSGEVNAGPVPDDDPLTHDTNDDPETAIDIDYSSSSEEIIRDTDHSAS